ncbi:MAG TPA: ribonuclease domain-containing protein [Usitatibacter sp.]|nr:ribonuclease domain-containing protein [Usitatibacter sp.]
MIRRLVASVLAMSALGFIPGAGAQKAPVTAHDASDVAYAALPSEAKLTIALIRKGGPFPYAKDGAIFGNRERHLPAQQRGYYREYTVKTPGERTRGARRIIWGRGGEFYYTDDHYNHLRRVRE